MLTWAPVSILKLVWICPHREISAKNSSLLPSLMVYRNTSVSSRLCISLMDDGIFVASFPSSFTALLSHTLAKWFCFFALGISFFFCRVYVLGWVDSIAEVALCLLLRELNLLCAIASTSRWISFWSKVLAVLRLTHDLCTWWQLGLCNLSPVANSFSRSSNFWIHKLFRLLSFYLHWCIRRV